MYSISLDISSHLLKWRMLETYMSLNILFSSSWGKFWLKRFKIDLFLKQKYKIFRGFFEIFRKFFGIFRHFFENFRKDIRRFYVIFVSRPSHKVISFIITVTCLPSLQKYKGVTLPYTDGRR